MHSLLQIHLHTGQNFSLAACAMCCSAVNYVSKLCAIFQHVATMTWMNLEYYGSKQWFKLTLKHAYKKGTRDLKKKDLVSMYLHGTQTDLLAMVIYQFFCGIQCRMLLKFSWLLCLHSTTAQGDYLQIQTYRTFFVVIIMSHICYCKTGACCVSTLNY